MLFNIYKYYYLLLIFFITYVKNKNELNTEIYIPYWINDNKTLHGIDDNIKELINQFHGKINLINTKDTKKNFEKYTNEYENIREWTHSSYFYKKMNMLTTLSRIYMVQLQCFKIAMNNIKKNMDGIFIMEQDVQLNKNSFYNMQNYIQELNTKKKGNNFVIDFYNYFLFDEQNQKGTSWYPRLLGRIKDGLENQHVYEKNNCMGIQLMYYPKKIIHSMYKCLTTFYTDKIHLTNLAIDNCLTYCCGINKIKILTTKQQLITHKRIGSTWNKNINKKQTNCRPINNHEDISYCVKMFNNDAFFFNVTNNIHYYDY